MAEANGIPDWQTTKSTILERNKYMFGNKLMSDVLFVYQTGYSRETFPAHKYVLSTASPVFFSMFYGETKEDDEVKIIDVSFKAFHEMLRFLYTDETELDRGCVLEVLYLAKKYIIPSLVEKCSKFLESNTDETNALEVLQQGIKCDEATIIENCWEGIEFKMGAIVETKEFLGISNELLCRLLQRDHMEIEEIDLFQAVAKWADEQCKLKSLKCNGGNKREVLGEALDLIRFENMDQKDFATRVLEHDVLTFDEVKKVMLSWHKEEKIKSVRRRKEWRCSRFANTGTKWEYTRLHPDKVQFSTDKSISFRGVQLFGSQGGSYNVQLSIYENLNTAPLKTVKGTFVSKEHPRGQRYDIFLNLPLKLTAGIVYVIEANIQGPVSLCGNNGLSEVTEKDVVFTFSSASTPNNGTSVSGGQIPVIIFSPLH